MIKQRVTNGQIFSILFSMIVGFGFASMSKDIVSAVGTEGYITVFIHTAIITAGAILNIYLGYTFKNKTIFEYSEVIAGKTVSKIVGVYLILLHNYLLISVLLKGMDYLKLVLFPKTPSWVIVFIAVFVAGYIASKKLSAVARVMQIVAFISIITIGAIIITIFTQSDLGNLKPFFGTQTLDTHLKAIIDFKIIVPYMGIEMLQVIPFSNINTKKVFKYGIAGTLTIGLCYLLLTECTIAYMGVNQAVRNAVPIVAIVKRFPYSIIRIDAPIYSLAFLMLLLQLTYYIYASTFFTGRLFKKAKTFTLFAPNTIIPFVIVLIIPIVLPSLSMSILFDLLGVFESIAAFIIPVVLVIIMKIRKIKKPKKTNQQDKPVLKCANLKGGL